MRFVVTAFGPFGGMPFNPCMALVLGKGGKHQGIVEFLKEHPLSPSPSSSKSSSSSTTAPTVSTLELPVSASGVVSSLTALYSALDLAPPDSSTVVLHLGVDGSQRQYANPRVKLERTAHNCLDFRIPDNDGFQPRNVSIEEYCAGACKHSSSSSSSSASPLVSSGDVWTPTPSLPPSSSSSSSSSDLCQVRSSLFGLPPPPSSVSPSLLLPPSPLDAVFARLENAWNATTPLLELSDDPGRFVCNFCLYHSLMHCAALNATTGSEGSEEGGGKGKVFALFVHVPPFELVGEETQLRVLRDIMQVLIDVVGGGETGEGTLLGRPRGLEGDAPAKTSEP